MQTRKTEPIQKASKRSEATIALDKRLRTIADGSYFAPKKERLMFDAVAEEFLEWARAANRAVYNYKIAIDNARAMFGGKSISEMTVGALEAFRVKLVERLVEKRAGEKLDAIEPERRKLLVAKARATSNRRMTVLRKMFNRLVEQDRITESENPFRRGKLKPYGEAENARTRYFTAEEIARLLQASTQPFRSLLALALCTGLRQGELRRLQWANWDQSAGLLWARLTKGGKPRAVPVNATAKDILERLRDDSHGAHIFHDQEGRARTKSWVESTWRRVARRVDRSRTGGDARTPTSTICGIMPRPGLCRLGA